MRICKCISIFFFNDTATTEIYTLSLHDALPISAGLQRHLRPGQAARDREIRRLQNLFPADRLEVSRRELPPAGRSEEHTSELQSQSNIVCRLLLEKKIEQ